MINKAAVIGAGLMGCGIARHLKSQIDDILLLDVSRDQINRASAAVDNAGLRFTSSFNDLEDRDFVIEAVFEDLSTKRNVLEMLSDTVSEKCIVATNTSSLLVRDLAGAVSHPERFVGIHYNNPADMNRVVEIIGTEHTDENITSGMLQWMRSADKLAIRCADTACFILNRQSLPYINEAARCLKIASPGEVDQVAVSKLGVGLGPFAVMNLVGLPVMAAASRNLSVLGEGYKPSDQLQAQSAPWDIESVSEVDANVASELVRRLRGAMIFPGKDILDQALCSREDLHEICVQALGYEKSSVEWLEILKPSVQDELIRIYLSHQNG